MAAEFDRKNHWENIYSKKLLTEVSWYQPTPQTSLDLIAKLNLDKDASIIDIGGGDGYLVDHLLDLGYTDITVLDISVNAIERAKKRLGSRASEVKWIVSDITSFQPEKEYDVWHDRAVFHFLTSESDIKKYQTSLESGLASDGYLVIGTFSDNGPLKCSGIEISQYAQNELIACFNELTPIKTFNQDHPTPFDTIQNFTFGVFRR
jgi:2-polyprenyl-3-methyl-5-hydroxy-6-metoxy-1,4-benzoquinol methylase